MIQVLPDDSAYLRKLWAALNSPHAQTLALVLGDIQKDGYPAGYADWKDFVVDVMEALHGVSEVQLELMDEQAKLRTYNRKEGKE